MSIPSVISGLQDTIPETTLLKNVESSERYDIVIKFQSAEDLPKMDMNGDGDPYFIAKIGDHAVFKSSILSNTRTPQWEDEEWILRNIPIEATLLVVLYDRDDNKPTDDYIGQFEVLNLINYDAPADGHNIVDLCGNNRGRFHLSVQSMTSSTESKQLPSYTFDGPCRYSRHDLVALGRLTMLNTNCVYITWKIQMRRISVFFPPHQRQYWNKEYKIARQIFGSCPLSIASRTALKVAHKALYGRTLKHSQKGRLDSADDLWKTVFRDPETHKIKPCVYTYIIDDNTWRFSETGNQFFTDLASKHALLANGSESVRYAGEFHPRPKYGWDRLDDEWELVFDNGSGTYAPNINLLINLKKLLLFNFPGLNVVTYGYKDPELTESMTQLKQMNGTEQTLVKNPL